MRGYQMKLGRGGKKHIWKTWMIFIFPLCSKTITACWPLSAFRYIIFSTQCSSSLCCAKGKALISCPLSNSQIFTVPAQGWQKCRKGNELLAKTCAVNPGNQTRKRERKRKSSLRQLITCDFSFVRLDNIDLLLCS